MFHSRKLLSKFTQKTLKTAFFSDEEIFKVKKLHSSIYNSKSNTKVNAKYYCNVLLKNMISEINRPAKHNHYLFMQVGARAHTGKLTLEMSKDKKQDFQITDPSLATE